MKHRSLAINAALRVMECINEKRSPEDADVRTLEAFAGPRAAEMPLDDFVSLTLRKAIQELRAAQPAMAAGAAGIVN